MKKFQPSININYDIGKPELFEQFVPNVNQLDILVDIISGVTKNDNNTHLLIGPYGAGKSMVGALAASIVTARKNSKLVKGFINNVSTVSVDTKKVIEFAVDAKTNKWISVSITGRKGEFSEIILEAITQSLRNEGISFSLKGESESIIKTVSNWEKEYPETFNKFKVYCSRLNIGFETFITAIKSGEEEAIIKFKNMYSQLTSGAEFISQNKVSFLEQINYLIHQLSNKKIGMFIIFDEFGRFLQTVNQEQIYHTMQDLQDLAELLNRVNNFGALFITHTGLSQYAASNNNLTTTELERVEKRFKNHRLESDPSLFFRSAFKILEMNREDSGANLFLIKDLEYLRSEILKYNLFPEMTPQEIDGAILEGCQPIHPLALRLLPTLSNILGQNDRTLYTFLAEIDKYSLDSEWYYADKLFNYFYPDESAFYLIEELKYLRSAYSYHVSEEAIRVIKFMTLLKITNSTLNIDENFLAFSLGLSQDTIKGTIKELKNKKLVRYNRFASSYELFSGSIIEFERLVEEYRTSQIITNTNREDFIGKLFSQNYFLPIEYNNEKSMIRYIESIFSLDRFELKKESTADGIVVYILDPDFDPKYDFENLELSNVTDTLYCIPLVNSKLLKEYIDKYIILNTMLKDNLILEQDKNIRNEIEISIENTQYEIQKILAPLEEFNNMKANWYFKGKPVQGFFSKENFQSYLSEWMFEKYPDTLEVRNEGFNKRNVSSIQKKSAIEVLQGLLRPTFNGELEIEGYGPDYLIYASLLKNNGYSYEHLDNLENGQLFKMRQALTHYLEHYNRGKISDLFSILLSEPFGMRKPIVPLLCISLIRDYWNKMAFYANDFYVDQMNADLLYDIIEQDVDFYEYEMYQLTSNQEYVLRILNETFFNNLLPQQPAIIFSELLTWLRKLPRITQITEDQPKEVLLFKNAIRHSETDPLESLRRVQAIVEENSNKVLNQLKSSLENHIFHYKESISNQVKSILDVDNWITWGENHKQLISDKPVLRLVHDKAIKNEDWLSVLIEKTVGSKIEDWSDVTGESFKSSINQLSQIQSQEGQITLSNSGSVLLNIEETELSVKGKTIYSNLNRVVTAGGRNLSKNEVKYILYKILTEIEE
ncbi:hypothetical protein P6709_09945 [Jeotgalibacillus sp. ET6]|uniref:hypothetical protein n=1 Tax=Jeotgalibacillus sp. ET6 TaxID=3037260 RepID=UPI0024182877|nr:hypothetical protein [Jeotgalibacillus sp. ET6]MDG5472073.1 hypothetical protein [Jeotgalibacillus sp. ET6]